MPAISQHDKFFQPVPRIRSFLSFHRAHNTCIFFVPAEDKKDVARRRRDPRMVLSAANGLRWHVRVSHKSNHVLSLPRSQVTARIGLSRSKEWFGLTHLIGKQNLFRVYDANLDLEGDFLSFFRSSLIDINSLSTQYECKNSYSRR